MSISSRKAGAMVQCPTCGEQTLVPLQDIFDDAPQSVIPGMPAEAIAAPASFAPASFAQAESPASESPPQSDAPGVEADSDEPDADDVPGFRLLRRQRIDDEMDLTPMVDVTFQLLIFFMVTASFALQKSIEVPSMDQDKKGAAQQLLMLDEIEATSIQVKIDANNAILVDDEPVPDPSLLTDVLRTKMRKEQKTELLISANSAALHRSVVAVIDAANEVGMQKIRMASRPGKAD
jgi:biopolymer transport protein ExbD